MCDGGGGGGDGGGGGGGDFGGGGGDGFHDSGGYHGGYHDDHHHYDDGSPQKQMPWWIPLIFTSCFTVIAALVGVVTLVESFSKQSWAEVTGTVIAINQCSSSGGNGRTYSATVEYEVDGELYQYTGDSCSSLKPTVGNELRVVYNPDDPSDGANGTFSGLWLVPIIAIGLSFLMCGGGILIILRHKKANNSANPSGQSMDTGNAASGGMGMTSSQPASTYNQTSSSTYPAATTGTSTFANSLGDTTPTSTPVQSSYGYNTSTSSSAPASTQNNNSAGKPSLFDQMASGV